MFIFFCLSISFQTSLSHTISPKLSHLIPLRWILFSASSLISCIHDVFGLPLCFSLDHSLIYFLRYSISCHPLTYPSHPHSASKTLSFIGCVLNFFFLIIPSSHCLSLFSLNFLREPQSHCI